MMSEHTGTHFGALCHQGLNHRLYGDIDVASEIEPPYGFTVHRVEKVGPIATRDILLDVARCKGMGILLERYSVSSSDLQDCCEVEGLKPGRADALFVRIGNGAAWDVPEGYALAAGVSLEATQ
jgi:hypothetical protein